MLGSVVSDERFCDYLFAGLDAPAEVSEEYDVTRHAFSVFSSNPSPTEPAVADSIPVDGATDVRITDILAVRFTEAMSVQNITSKNVILQDSAGHAVQTTVTGAETGRLVFVIPSSPLQFGTSYLLTLQNVADGNTKELPTNTIPTAFRSQSEYPTIREQLLFTLKICDL